MHEMDITFSTLTPLWTGSVDGKMDRIHETGILGSLRWWYEVLVRGLGGEACDPSQSRNKCLFDAKKYTKSKTTDERQRLRDAGLCDVCQVFGATGWRRRFRLEVVEDKTVPAWMPPLHMVNVRPPDRSRGWYLPPGRIGTFTLRLTGDRWTLSLLTALLSFIEKWGNLGTKPQLGYGLFRVENQDEITSQEKGFQWELMESGKTNWDLPDLRRFIFFRYRFRPDGQDWWDQVPGLEDIRPLVQRMVREHEVVPIAPALKNEWRYHRWKKEYGDQREVFGALTPERRRSRVAVGWAYRPTDKEWEIRGWAWLPARKKEADGLLTILEDQTAWKDVLCVEGTLELTPYKPALFPRSS